MIEVLQIIFFALVFTLFLFVPLNVFSKTYFLNNDGIIENTTLNLVINLNILLFLSFLPISVHSLQPFIFSGYIIILIFYYGKNFNLVFKYLKSFFPLFVIFFLLAINISTELYLGWDAKFFYYIKSLFFYEHKSIFDLNQFEHSVWHPHYGSYLWGFFWTLSFVDFEYFGRLFYLFLFCYSFFIISKISKTNLVNNIVFLILIFLSYEYSFFSGLQEVLIFSFLIILSKYFFLISEKKSKNDFIYLCLILLFSNLLIWIKSEGVVYFFILLILLLIQNQISIKKKLLFSGLFIIFYLLKLSIYEIADLDNGQKAVYNLQYILNLDFNIIFHKLIRIFIWFIYYISNNIFFALFILLMIYEKLFEKNNNKTNLDYQQTLLVYLFSIIIFIIFAYTLRDMEIEYSIRTTMDRLVMTASGFFIYPSVRLLTNRLFKFSP